MRHSIQHDLPPEALREAVRRFAEVYCKRFEKYHATAQWHGDDRVEVRFKVKGVSLSGTLELLPREISIEMDVPFALRLFKGRAIKAIEEEVQPWLDRAKRGELS